MPAAYDTYDYPSYWKGRDYEHQSELYALRRFLENIPKCRRVVEIGAGYGRLIPQYLYKAKEIIITEPSAKLLKLARQKNKGNIKFIQSRLENLDKKIKPESVDLIIMVRVIHHIKDIEECFKRLNKLLAPGGYLILEFPNKMHFKASLKELLKGNITYPIDIRTKELKSRKPGDRRIPIFNYHPDKIIHSLNSANFYIVDKRSVSNIRSRRVKKIVPVILLIFIEKWLQKLLSPIKFGPSMFILARKKPVLT